MNVPGQLRTIRDDELNLMLSWRNAPAVRANMYNRHEISKEEHLAWWARTSQRTDQLYFMYENEGQPLGIVGITAIDMVNGNCSWAFYASPEAPRGTGSRMEYLTLEYIFGLLKMHKLYCEVLAFNAPVLKLHKKFGFIVEGIFRQHHQINDIHIDIYRLGLLQEEWARERVQMKNKLTALLKG